jgi:putative oxidoreductase
MQKFVPTLARVLLSQIFLIQFIILIYGFMHNPTGYQDYQVGLGMLGLPGIFAPLIILVNLVGGLALFLGYKTKLAAIVMAIWAVLIAFLLKLPPLQYLAIAGGLLLLSAYPSTALSLDNLKK